MSEYSILRDKNSILTPNSLFERRIILQYYLDNDIQLNTDEKKILQNCQAIEPESIGIIGCLLEETTHLNTLRLAIGSKNTSNIKLEIRASLLLSNLDLEKADLYFMMKDSLTDIEQEVYYVYNMIYFSN